MLLPPFVSPAAMALTENLAGLFLSIMTYFFFASGRRWNQNLLGLGRRHGMCASVSDAPCLSFFGPYNRASFSCRFFEKKTH